jgi:uncharacterized protein YndB with AHSA1/START domain
MSVERGFLLLADISGYTGYLAETELDHAHEILSGLLGEVVAGLTPPLRLAAIEGDAVFAYGPLARGETVLEAIETTYLSFLRTRDVMEARTSCPCNACRQVGSLDLKFIVHHGEYTLQGLTGTPNPIGSDVNLAHRLLKNSVVETTGFESYVLLTRAAVDATGVTADAFRPGTETYEHLGEIPTWSYDLAARARVVQEHFEPEVPIAACDWVTELELPAPPEVVWEWLNDTTKYPLWHADGLRFEEKERPGGRAGAGGVVHCYHGSKNPFVIKVTDWRPISFVGEEFAPAPGMRMRMVHELEPAGEGRTLVRHGFRMFAPVPGRLRRPLCRKAVAADAIANLERLHQRLTEQAAAPAEAPVAEPAGAS